MAKQEGDADTKQTMPVLSRGASSMSVLQPGDLVLGRYEILRTLGVGGMGQVFCARHQRINREVAVKVLPEDGNEEHAQRFQREAALMTRVRHPNVVEILDFGFVNGSAPCIVMELVEGEILSARLERKRVLPWVDAVKIILGVLDGLEAVHDAAILHRDLKPSNVAMTKGPPEVVKLLDFGIARSLLPSEGDRRVTRTGNIVGSLDYMSPEALVNDPLDLRTDVYAAAMMLYEMCTGGFPFKDEAMAAAFKRLSTDPPTPVAPAGFEPIPGPVAELILRGLSRDRALRPATADEYATALRDVLRPRRGTDPNRPVEAARATEPIRQPEPIKQPEVVRPHDPPRIDGSSSRSPRADDRRSLPGIVQPSAVRTDPPTGSGPQLSVVARPQFVVLARLPPGKLPLLEERRWLAELIRDAGKAYALGTDLWCAVLIARESSAAEKQSLVLLDALESRYPNVRVVGGTIFDPRFELRNNPQGTPLPEPLPGLIAQLSAMG